MMFMALGSLEDYLDLLEKTREAVGHFLEFGGSE